MPKITEIYAFISTDKHSGDEGVLAMRVHGQWMPLVVASKANVETLKPIAQRIAADFKVNIVLAKFSIREDVETITPA